MAKKWFSFMAVHKPKLMKKRDKKKRLLPKSVLDFLKSDSYMFAPLVSSQNFPFTSSTTGIEANGYIQGKPKNFLRKVKDYMISDCYMYAPLVLNQPWLRSAVCPAHARPGSASFSGTTADTRKQKDTTENVTGKTGYLGRNIKSIRIRDQHAVQYPSTRSAVIKHSLLQKETVKNVIQQNVLPSSMQGKLVELQPLGAVTAGASLNSINGKRRSLEDNGRNLLYQNGKHSITS